MNITKFTPLIFLLMPYVFFSQNSVSGNIQNQNKEPVAFANVILLSAEDSTSVYKGTISEEDGSFIIENVQDSIYLLKVSFVGYAENLQKLKVKGETKVRTISLEESTDDLDEVVVNARKPKISRKVDRIVFDVENSTLSTGNTFDILKRTPGVIVSQGNLLVKNRPATVYINDRKVYLSSQELQQLLEGFSGTNVKSVEVITNPPARYDAEGGAILNITTSKNISIGYKGSLNASHTTAIVPKYNIGTSQYYKNDWVNIYASYNYNGRDEFKQDDSYIEFFDSQGGEVDSRWLTDFERNTYMYSHSLNTILDFTLSEASTLSLSANIQIIPDSDSDINGLTNIYDSNNSLNSLFTTDSRLHSNTDNILLAATYNTSLGDNGSLSAIGNYINYDNSQFQQIMTNYFDEDESFIRDNSFTTEAMQNSEIYTGQIDISTPLGSTSFETGLKFSRLKTESGQDYFDTNTGTRQFSGELSDLLDYDENIYAAYASISRDWEKWAIKLGLRGEYTDVQGDSRTFGTVNTQEYFELFPTFYLSYNPAEKHSFGLDYSRRISRPRFQSLNSYRYFINENNFQDGNPNLMPSFSNKITFNYNYDNTWFFDLYWDRADNAMALLPFQDNQNRTLRSVNLNMNYDQQFSFDVTYYSYLKDWWVLSAYSSFFYMENEFPALESGGQLVKNDVFSTYIQAYNYFILGKDGTFSAEVIGTFLPKYIAGSYQFDEPQYGLTLGLKKTFFDSRLTATVNLEDAFNSMNIPLKSQYLNQNNGFFAKPESRMLRLGLIYKFGNFKLNDNSRAINAEESERLQDQKVLD
ncbi:outer membrane beta-barrel family protein [Christiangramia sp. SM2212]|uniref:Outer membrane beta-barrel family protein n=1 Tax=Christiangramia sediminicola TaxID=3073267 RepID=A0ABU1ESG9_9FLAO|nr:outer membrane beta-barrel family protein [Christiangramia sp. SM2212]MDR5591340.1 outer membrane beta-barrel family protein [Christiangramia sp. SM2212]